jgi:hypothetical protein
LSPIVFTPWPVWVAQWMSVVDRSGEDLPRLPKQTLFLPRSTPEYRMGNLSYLVSSMRCARTSTIADQSSCVSGVFETDQKIGARISWLSTNEQWRITLWGEPEQRPYIEGGIRCGFQQDSGCCVQPATNLGYGPLRSPVTDINPASGNAAFSDSMHLHDQRSFDAGVSPPREPKSFGMSFMVSSHEPCGSRS